MSRLLIKQVKYYGEQYYYESPLLQPGINILEGENGAGKSTFCSLIYYGLGGTVKWFKSDNNQRHIQIVDDKSNYVEITFIIDQITYSATRFIGKFEVSIISENDVKTFPINRSENNPYTFSDWFLDKLKINVVEIYQGSEFHKINFQDLFRLMYHDQTTATDKIFKAPDNENYFTDSIIVRKAIFEILLGNSFDEYYKSIADYRKILDEQSTLKSLIQNFESLNVGSNILLEGKNSFALNREISEFSTQLEKLEQFRESINDNVTSIKSTTEILSQKRSKFSEHENTLMNLRKDKSNIVDDYMRVKRVRENTMLEVTHLKKIIITNEKLNLFSPETCPYCLKTSVRQANKCICGSDVSDEEYQKFFYSKEDYLNILKSKQKNIETLDLALVSYEQEVKEINGRIALFENRISELSTEISHLVKGRRVIKNVELREVNDKILEIEKNISAIRQQIKIEKKREELEQKKSTIVGQVEEKKRIMEIKKLEAGGEMQKIITKFNEKYYALMHKGLHDCRSARISSDDYLPIINGGVYKEASSNVSKRIIYYFTLLHLSLVSGIKFPKFLLIDTPENIGIDAASLVRILLLIDELGNDEHGVEDGQIILTTGENKYPQEYEGKIFQRISKANQLLIKRTLDITL